MKKTWKKVWDYLLHTKYYFQALVKWLALATVTGIGCGAVGSAFHIGVHEVTLLREEFPWLLYLLPVAGLAIVGF